MSRPGWVSRTSSSCHSVGSALPAPVARRVRCGSPSSRLGRWRCGRCGSGCGHRRCRRAATRRAGSDDAHTLIRIGHTAIDLAGRTVTRSGPDGQPERVTLTPTEWQLLEVLLTHPGRLISQRQLLSELRGQPGYTDSSYLRLYIAQLRHKLEDEPSRPRHLLTEPGMGYRYQP